MLYPIAFSSRVQNVVPHFFAILGINFRRVEVSIEGRDDKKKNKKKRHGFQGYESASLAFYAATYVSEFGVPTFCTFSK